MGGGQHRSFNFSISNLISFLMKEHHGETSRRNIDGERFDPPVMQEAPPCSGARLNTMIASAHRTLKKGTRSQRRAARPQGDHRRSGLAALAGVVASQTTLPVIGVPIDLRRQGLAPCPRQMPGGACHYVARRRRKNAGVSARSSPQT
jgi:phosphoribosylcarboxyaminoimidazole (NCAIR) mutase